MRNRIAVVHGLISDPKSEEELLRVLNGMPVDICVQGLKQGAFPDVLVRGRILNSGGIPAPGKYLLLPVTSQEFYVRKQHEQNGLFISPPESRVGEHWGIHYNTPEINTNNLRIKHYYFAVESLRQLNDTSSAINSRVR